MSFIIPIDRQGDTLFAAQVPLDGELYTLEFRWNERAQAWFLDVLDSVGEGVFAAGLRLVVNWPLAAYGAGRTPPGALVLVDTGGEYEEAGLDDLGVRHQLVYYTSAELGL